MKLRQQQDQFIADMEKFPDWNSRFNFFILLSKIHPNECPDYLRPFRIDFCQSRTYFKAYLIDNKIHLFGWSNSAILGGIIVSIMNVFSCVDVSELKHTEIDFHIRSGLTGNTTPMRNEAVKEMIRRITVLLPG